MNEETKKVIQEKIEEKTYKKDNNPNPANHEQQKMINTYNYVNGLTESEKKAFKEQLEKKKLRDNYLAYLKYIYGDNYVLTDFHKLLANIAQTIVERIERGEHPRLLLSVPPQTGKSTTITEALPSWFIGRNPNLSCIITAYNADIAEKFGDRNRQKVKDFGNEIFGIQISDSQDSKTLFQIKGHQGQVFSTGILGGLTSNPSALTIVDDPFKNGEEVENKELRDKVERVYWDSINTRSRPLGSGIIVIHTRWHEDDLIGRLAKKQGFIVVNIPLVWEKGYDKLLHRKVGEVLTPELGRTALWAENLRKNVGARVWNALYQGKPFVEGGNIIQRKDIRFYNKKTIPLKFDEIVLSCDLSFGGIKKNNDPNCGLVWGRVGGNHYLLKRFNKKCGFQETINLIKLMCNEYPEMRKKIIEKKANGSATIELLNQQISGILPFDPKGDSKETRLKLVAPYFESGNIFVDEDDEDIEEVIEQWLKFPNVAHDEYVDTTTQYLLDYSYKYDGGHIETDSVYKKLSAIIRGI